jgi:2,3-bisphosphoglycerate-independent phosphoglycerate mutase
MKKPLVVLIRDGWGYRETPSYNGPVKSLTPFTDTLMEKYDNILINASGEAVGLPAGYMGNSEVGHLTIGSGRINNQPLVRINKSIEDQSFFQNKAFLDVIQNCKTHNSTLHLLGLLQVAGVHSHANHLFALLDLCKKEDFRNVVVHIFSDGRDSPVDETYRLTKKLLAKFEELGFGKIATISGRYFAMDRDKRWDRTEKAYRALVEGNTIETFEDPLVCFDTCYDRDETDEFIIPQKASWYDGMNEHDGSIFFNFRTDRPRQLTRAMIEEEFVEFERKATITNFVAMTEFYTPLPAPAAFDTFRISNTLGKVLADAGKNQLRISETEKYAHVTFFFNGQVEKPNINEDRILVPSPKVATYDLQPEMSINEISDKVLAVADKYDVIVINFVNGDMVGHTGDWEAVVKACHAVDQNVQKVVERILAIDGHLLIFADHGNCEEMEGKYRTSHTTNQVPLLYVANEKKDFTKRKGGLQDISPTVLKLLNIQKPSEMTGESFL